MSKNIFENINENYSIDICWEIKEELSKHRVRLSRLFTLLERIDECDFQVTEILDKMSYEYPDIKLEIEKHWAIRKEFLDTYRRVLNKEILLATHKLLKGFNKRHMYVKDFL